MYIISIHVELLLFADTQHTDPNGSLLSCWVICLQALKGESKQRALYRCVKLSKTKNKNKKMQNAVQLKPN